MANRLYHSGARGKLYITGYLAMLLLAFSGLALEGGVFVFVGLTCWGCAILSCLHYYDKNIRKLVKNESLNTEDYVEGKKARAISHS